MEVNFLGGYLVPYDIGRLNTTIRVVSVPATIKGTSLECEVNEKPTSVLITHLLWHYKDHTRQVRSSSETPPVWAVPLTFQYLLKS